MNNGAVPAEVAPRKKEDAEEEEVAVDMAWTAIVRRASVEKGEEEEGRTAAHL